MLAGGDHPLVSAEIAGKAADWPVYAEMSLAAGLGGRIEGGARAYGDNGVELYVHADQAAGTLINGMMGMFKGMLKGGMLQQALQGMKGAAGTEIPPAAP